MLFVALAVMGCAAHPDPIVDTKGVNQEQLAKDWAECEAYTEQIAVGQGVAKGSAAGAVVDSEHQGHVGGEYAAFAEGGVGDHFILGLGQF